MGSNLIPDYDWINSDFGGSDGELRWTYEGFNDLPNPGVEIGVVYKDMTGNEHTSSKKSVEIGDVYKDVNGHEQTSSKKRGRDELCDGPRSKACREKMRRDKLNDRFLELGSVLDPSRPPKSDKATILSDAARALIQLRSEAEKLKESNEKLQETIKDLKTEKNELRDEKIKLKADKERLEQQVKAMSMPPPAYMPHPAALHAAATAAFAAQGQAAANKTASFSGFPGMAMWQWMPPAMIDTSQDHKLRSPVA